MSMVHAHDPETSWRNQQRVQFIKGFYKMRHIVLDLCRQYEQNEVIKHEMIDSLLESHLRNLKDLSHTLYRMPDTEQIDRKKQRLFDKVLGEVWHELDKARDNIRLIEAYTEQSEESEDKMVRSINRLRFQVLAVAQKDLPRQIRRTRRMMEKLVPLFEKILPVYEKNEIICRSLYFSRKDLDPYCRPSTVEYFFPLLFGSLEAGYLALVKTLAQTKHISAAQGVLNEFRNYVSRHPKSASLLKTAENELKTILKESPALKTT